MNDVGNVSVGLTWNLIHLMPEFHTTDSDLSGLGWGPSGSFKSSQVGLICSQAQNHSCSLTVDVRFSELWGIAQGGSREGTPAASRQVCFKLN